MIPGELSLEAFSEAHIFPWFAVNALAISAVLRHACGSPAVCVCMQQGWQHSISTLVRLAESVTSVPEIPNKV